MSNTRTRAIQANMDVYTSDAARLGRVKQIGNDDFLVDREHARDIIVPHSLVRLVLDGEQRVELSLTEADARRYKWEHPDLI